MKTVSMEAAIYNFPDYLVEARKLAEKISLPDIRIADVKRIVILGMGGSAIGGDLVKALGRKLCKVPIHVIRDETIPAYIDGETLVLAVSCSGNTQETLHAYGAALSKTRNLLLFSTGGLLEQEALKENLFQVKIPDGLMPRAALPLTFVSLLIVLEKLGFLPGQTSSLQEVGACLQDMRDKLSNASSGKNPALELAKKLHGKLPIIYASSPLLETCALRWKCQINENAKQPAYCGTFPEIVHNEIVGFTKALPIHCFFSVIMLRGQNESAVIGKRIQFMKKIVAGAGAQVHEVVSQGESLLAVLLSLCYYGDYVSLHLAKENGVDPFPIKVIEALKQELGA